MNQIHYNIRQYCKEYTQIENYDKAKADNFIGWSCHHKLEIHSDYKNSMLDLIMMNLYYNRPPEELIFIKTTEHRIMHNKVRKLSYSIKSKIGASRKVNLERNSLNISALHVKMILYYMVKNAVIMHIMVNVAGKYNELFT